MYRHKKIIYAIVLTSIASMFAAAYFTNDHSLPKIPRPTEVVGYIVLGIVVLLILVASVWAYREMDSFALPIVIVGIALAFVGIPNLQEKWKTLPKTPGPSLEPVKDLNKDKWTYCEANECFPIRLKELSQERIAFTVLRTNSDLIFEWNLAGKRYWKVGSTSGKVKFYKSSKGVYFGAVQSSNRQHWGPFYLTRVGNFRGFQRDLMEVSERYLEEWEWCSSDSCIPAKMDFLNDERMVFVTRTTLGNGWRKNTRYHKCVWEQAGQGYCHLSTDANKERGEMEMRKVSAGHFVGILRSGQNRRHFQLTRKYHYD